MAIGYFYDIESLANVFTLVNFRSDVNVCDVYYLVDDDHGTILQYTSRPNTDEETIVKYTDEEIHRAITDRIHKRNKNFTGSVECYDLKKFESNRRLAQTFGLSDACYTNNPDEKSNYSKEYRLKCDTDSDYDENKDYYLFGYNSNHYDTTMLSMYFYDAMPTEANGEKSFKPIRAHLMRQYNDELFSPAFDKAGHNMEERLRFAYKNAARPAEGYGPMNYRDPKAVIRKNMLMSGRHIDVAKLNEKQSKVGLKRLLGMIGYQILESDKLSPNQNEISNFDEFLELIAYNVSDCVNLKKLFEHKIYQSSFKLKKQLLKDYPELIYKRKTNGDYAPDISPKTVRNDRLTIDSSSAQFSTKALCPYDHLHDYDTVSFMYPSEKKAKELGIPRVNVLEEARKFFYSHFPQPELRAKFDEIYNYYKSIEGKNFNSSNNYLCDHGVDPDDMDPYAQLSDGLEPQNLKNIPAPNTCMFYYNKDGTPSSCFVNFSTGGIHGAEYNKALYEYDLKKYDAVVQKATDEWQASKDLLERVKQVYPNPCDLKINKGIIIDGIKHNPSEFLKPKATATEAYYKDSPKEPKLPKKPELFKKMPSGSWKIDNRYTYTSADLTNHEDFTSYYPNMLRMMDAFFNTGLGYDRYGEIFDNKTKYGIYMNDETRSEEERGMYATMRNGTKLILNSASGAADANFESNIRMNNKIISMRIIGQLFTWRIGQAQTIEGAKMTSTNTDGLYSVLEATLNNKILERESESIHVEIEPEPIYLISKDSNNRMEVKLENNQLTKITSASGSTLSCRKGPTPDKSLDHPAIIDWALAEYLILSATNYKTASMTNPFDRTLGLSILKSARQAFNDDIQTMTMFQNVLASSSGTQRYIFATLPGTTDPVILQHYNRCFIMKDGTPNTYNLAIAAGRKITESMFASRKRSGEKPKQNDPLASEILTHYGVNIQSLPPDKETTILKITGVESTWSVRICNKDLHLMPQDEIDELFDNIDYEKYLDSLESSFENNWRNTSVEYAELAERKKEEDKAKKKKSTCCFLPEEEVRAIEKECASMPDDEKQMYDDLVRATTPYENYKEYKCYEKLGNKLSEKYGQDCRLTYSNEELTTLTKQKNNNISVNSISDEETNQNDTLFCENNDDKSECTENISVEKTECSPDRCDEDFAQGINPSEFPKTYQLKKTVLTQEDIQEGERILNLGGVRIGAEHDVLLKLFKKMTDTDF